MATTLDQYIQLVRSRHPAFEKRLVPDKALADFATTEQRRVLTLALRWDRQFLSHSLPIAVDVPNAGLNAPGIAGAGTMGGVPAMDNGQGGFTYVQQTVGSGVEVDTETVITLVDDTVVQSATANSLTALGVSWATNTFQDATVIIVAGTGANQPPRTIASNTNDTLVLSDDWAIQPDTTSVFRVVHATAYVDRAFGVVTNLPSLATQRGYLVRLTAQGVPYLDYTRPLAVSVTQGVPLPPYQSVLGGTVRYRTASPDSDYCAEPLTLVSFADRFRPARRPAAYLLNGALFLIGDRCDWEDVQGIELHYVPIPPAFTSRTDYFLLPDTAVQLLVARGAMFAASRIAGLPGIPQVPFDVLVDEASRAERDFLSTLQLTRNARVMRVREVW